VPSLFRRKPADLPAGRSADLPAGGSAERASTDPAEEAADGAARRGHTPSKRELGKATPKRRDPRTPRATEPPPATRREAARRMRMRERAEREERRKGMLAGDERYLLPRDRGPEKALARDVVDSRRTIGTWFFGFTIVLWFTTFAILPAQVRLTVNALWGLIGLATVLDVVLICRRIKALVIERFPKTQLRMRSLYWYAGLRALTFRGMRMPRARVKPGATV
jgi:hypothetical protein